MDLYSVNAGNFKLDGGAMFGVVPKSLWSKVYPADENNLCNWSLRCLLVKDDEKLILIDNGMGDKQDEKFFSHYYLNGDDSLKKSFSKYGFSFDDVTDVILTHLHFDHCGGSIKYDDNKNLVLAFKNAKFWSSKAQWEWATNPNNREKASFLKENILPLQENLKLIDGETDFNKNIKLKIYNGHTNGQIIPHINYNGKTLVYMGDLLPSTAHIPMPWVMGYDTRPLLTLEDKKIFFDEAIKNNYTLFLEHDLYNECCTIKQTEKGPRLDKTFDLKEFINA